jgi:BCCT family betaine/carnitine transporter
MARISRGRTFRDVVITSQTFGTLGCAMFFGIFGNNAMYQYLTGRFDFLAVTASQGESAAIVGALMHLTEIEPLAILILVIFIFVGFIYSATTVNSSAYAIATVASKDMTEGTDVEPHLFNRVIWALFLGGIALALMYQDEVVRQSAAAASGTAEAVAESTGMATTSVLTALKVSSLGVAIPLMVCVLISILSFLKWIKEDKPHLEKGSLPEESD